jgi:hypothetical protein
MEYSLEKERGNTSVYYLGYTSLAPTQDCVLCYYVTKGCLFHM